MRGQDPAPLELRLQARPESAWLLRERIRLWLETAGATKSETFEVVLAATEAFTNAVKHPQQPRSHLVDVEGSITDQSMSMSIRDYGTWQSDQTAKDSGGMGLGIMETLMDGVKVECLLDGTTVTMHRRLALH